MLHNRCWIRLLTIEQYKLMIAVGGIRAEKAGVNRIAVEEVEGLGISRVGPGIRVQDAAKDEYAASL